MFHELKVIPGSRKITYRAEKVNRDLVAKSRFEPENYQWPAGLLTRLRDHLQRAWNFFEKYSYWFDDITRGILHSEERRLGKKSVIFLLERDTWCTDEVFGDYFIERTADRVTVSYYRRGEKRRQFTFPPMTVGQIREWICTDVRKQVEEQFTFLWQSLATEIDSCIKEEFKRLPAAILPAEYTVEQYEQVRELLPDYPEAALLSLGRIAELWLLQVLGQTRRGHQEDLTGKARVAGLVNDSQARLLQSIRREYNLLKHDSTYVINSKRVEELREKFSILLTG